MKLAIEYYKELFGPGTGNMFAIDPNLWQIDENVTALENDHLTRSFEGGGGEIKCALFQIKKTKQ
jgi:hypothetical protein